jgi:Toxin with a conserved tryptophan and TIP tripeptide motif
MAETDPPAGDDCGGKCPPDQSRNARNKANKMSCAEILKKMNELMDTEKVGRAGVKGLMQRFRDFVGDDATHGPAILDQQRALRTYRQAYIDKGCGDPPPNAAEWANKPLPGPKQEEGMSNTDKALIGVGTVGTGYLIYRGVRMLPSLFPPLWWTAPANAIAP